MEIRSFRRVFDLERRIYRIDRLRLNPTGVPVRGIVYFLALLAATIVVSRAPLLAVIASGVPWYARDVVAPGLLASLLAVVRIDGRSFHLAARAMLRFRAGSGGWTQPCAAGRPARQRVGCVWQPPALTMLPDGSDPTLRRFRYRGPGAVRVSGPHRSFACGSVRARLGLGPHVVLRSGPSARTDDEVLVLERGARLHVR
jgi:hypothetical protein